ncbi:hypothetical protein C6497_09090 [Candidatus Poribacteria bacterium]|nr:MAG: hypothetical protein C6497_09090 [Candidatus Poribacteria bacterium]
MAQQPYINSCTDIQTFLEEYISGELDSQVESSIKYHLNTCDVCQKEYRMAQTIDTILDDLEKPTSPPEVLNEVMAYVRENQKKYGWLHKIPNFSYVSSFLRSPVLRFSTLILIIGMMLIGIHQYRRYIVLEQAKDEFYYAMSKVQIAVRKTSLGVNESFTSLNIDDAPRRALKPTIEISSSIQNTFDILHILTGSDRPEKQDSSRSRDNPIDVNNQQPGGNIQ